MPRLSRAQTATRQLLADLAARPLSPEQLGSALLDALTLAIPNDGQRLFGVDHATLLMSRLLAASANDQRARLEWLRDYYLVERSIPFMQFPDLMRAKLPVVGVHDSQDRCWGVPGELLYELSPRDFYRAYHEGRTPVGGAIHVSLCSEGRWIAALQMYRRDSSRPFTGSEVSFMHRLAPAMGRALDAAFARERALASRETGPGAAGVVILEPQNRLRYISPAGERWSQLLRDTDRHGHDLLPTVIWSAVAKLRQGVDDLDVGSLVAQTQAGPVRVEASKGGTDDSVVVVLAPERPPPPPEIPEDWPLTRQERQVATFVLQGLTNKEMATKLYVSEKTVESHLGNVYEKLGVRGRNHLTASYFRRTFWTELNEYAGSESSGVATSSDVFSKVSGQAEVP